VEYVLQSSSLGEGPVLEPGTLQRGAAHCDPRSMQACMQSSILRYTHAVTRRGRGSPSNGRCTRPREGRESSDHRRLLWQRPSYEGARV
jgi:hypothetical protein